MTTFNLDQIFRIVPDLLKVPTPRMWTDYDQEADVLYINFKKPSRADDSKILKDSIIVRSEHGKIVGITVLNAGKFSTSIKS